MIVHFCIRRKQYIIRLWFRMVLVWFRTGSNPININRFRSHTAKIFSRRALLNSSGMLPTINILTPSCFWKQLIVSHKNDAGTHFY